MEWMEKHPWATAGIVFAIGLAIIYYYYYGSGSTGAASGATGSDIYYSGSGAGTAYGTNTLPQLTAPQMGTNQFDVAATAIASQSAADAQKTSAYYDAYSKPAVANQAAFAESSSEYWKSPASYLPYLTQPFQAPMFSMNVAQLNH
jgi:hypothetical protein